MASTTTVPAPLARPTRTSIQFAVAYLLQLGLEELGWDMPTELQIIVVGLLTALVGAVQVAIEDKFGKAFLRNMPSDPVPLTDDANTGTRLVTDPQIVPLNDEGFEDEPVPAQSDNGNVEAPEDGKQPVRRAGDLADSEDYI